MNSVFRSTLPWLIAAPVLVVGGALLGRGAPALGSPTVATDNAVTTSRRVVGLPGPASGSAGPIPSLAPIVRAVAPAVVGIRTIHRQVPASKPGDAPTGVSRGTGFVFHGEGLILTAHHVVANPGTVIVEFPDLGELEAELVGEDASTDLAVVRLIDPPVDLSVVRFGQSRNLLAGDWIVMIGNPLGFKRTVDVGIVSHYGRTLAPGGLTITNEYLQVSATSFPGSSGSPIVDMHGEVVGIAIRSAREAPRMSFAIPSDVIGNVIESMERHDGRVRRAYLGVSLSDAAAGAGANGVQLSAVTPGQPAARAGLHKGDLVARFEGRPVTSVTQLYDWITWSEPRSTVRLDVVRAGRRLPSLAVELGEVGDLPQGLTH